MRRAAAWVLAAAAAWSGVVAAQAPSPPPMAGPARCRFVVPDGMPATDVRWSGGCRNGQAQGRGALRAYEGGQVVQIFFGKFQSGWPALGAIEVDGGFKAGRFEGNRPVADGDRDTLVRAFDEAAAAARLTANAFARSGNAASARFYRDKAQQLARQLD